jgi:benzoyl-CoA 2,3-dioxygenase component B
VLGDAEWEKRRGEFLPSDSDRDFIESLMKPQTELGKFAGLRRPKSASTTSRANLSM